jgi:hypothetical protein
MTKSQLISKIASAISKMEGYTLLTSLARKNNNPGNLRSWPSTPPVGGFAKFAKAEDGWKALYQQIEANIFGRGSRDSYRLRAKDGLTLREFFGGQRDEHGEVLPGGYPGYAPAADKNQPDHYAKYVATESGIDSIDVKLKSLINE